MAVKPFFSFSIDYGDGRTVLPQPRSATPEEKAARKARDIAAAAPSQAIAAAQRAAKYAAQQAEKARQQRAAKQASEPPGPGNSKRRGKPIIWDGDSACFSDLRYSASAGGVFATFIKGGGQYFYAMSRADAESWLVEYGDVTGEIFNSDIR